MSLNLSFFGWLGSCCTAEFNTAGSSQLTKTDIGSSMNGGQVGLFASIACHR
jgi:hypothetical protein